MHASESPERNALCLLARRENYETFTPAENAVSTCEGDELTTSIDLDIEIANLDIKITKQADFGAVVRQAWEAQAAMLMRAQHELLSWHYHLGHLPFNQLLTLACRKAGYHSTWLIVMSKRVPHVSLAR